MEIISDTTGFHLNRDTAVVIGKFDGLHIGHRKLLEEILKQKKQGMAACVFTFHPAPAVFFGRSDEKELTTREEKRIQLKHMGVDILIEYPMTQQTALMPARDFVKEVLCKQMQARYIAAGTDLSFGAGGKGDAVLLKQLEEECGYRVRIIDKVRLGGREISSTYVREQLEAGNMQLVEKLLGYPYTMIGTVVHGNRLGRRLGMPTVNLQPPANKLLPPCGVYDSSVRYQGKDYRAISNVGYKPSVTDERILGVESYLYDFEKEIYGEEIAVSLHEFRRPEKKFDSLEALKEQLAQDILRGAPDGMRK